MKHSSENELNALSSGLIGIMGVSLLIIPTRLHMFDMDTSIWVSVVQGIFAYAASISLQIISILQVPQKRIFFIQSAAVFFLFVYRFHTWQQTDIAHRHSNFE